MISIQCNPVNMPLVGSTGPVLVRCWQHRTITGPVLAHNSMFVRCLYQSLILYKDAKQLGDRFTNVRLWKFEGLEKCIL